MPYIRNAVHLPTPLAAALRCAAEGVGVSLQEYLYRAVACYGLLPELERDRLARELSYEAQTSCRWERLIVDKETLRLAGSLNVALCSAQQVCRAAWEWYVNEVQA